MPMYYFLLLVIITAGNLTDVFGENLFEQIGWKGATFHLIFLLVCIFILAVFVLIFLHIRSLGISKRNKISASENLFLELINKSGLTPVERNRLEELMKHEFIPYKHMIFQSALLFERCIDAEVKLLFLTCESKDEINDKNHILESIRKKLGYGYLPLEHPLLSTRNMEIGQNVSVFNIESKLPIINHAFISINKEIYFRVNYKKEGKRRILERGSNIQLAFARQGDAVYALETEICSVVSEFEFDCIHTISFQRNQLRQFVRMEVNLPIRIRLIKKEEDDKPKPFTQYIEGKLSDISGGGLSFYYKEPLNCNDEISMHFTLTTGKMSGINGKILRVTTIENNDTVMYKHHVQFKSIEQSLRDRIIHFIFEKQRIQNQIR